MYYVDARGLVCPKPVILAKKALQEHREIIIDVDNEMSCENLQKMAGVMDLSCEVKAEGNVFSLTLKACKDDMKTNLKEADAVPVTPAVNQNYIVVLSSQFAGYGNDELGAALMKSFIYTLTESEQLPECMVFYNGGVHLTTTGSGVLEDLHRLEAEGVEILSCGTCLNYYGLSDALEVGEVTNMYEIVERQRLAGKVIRI